ncbi:MAG: hypothetical protein ACQEUZ_12485 [Pseudomonadota bacterium]
MADSGRQGGSELVKDADDFAARIAEGVKLRNDAYGRLFSGNLLEGYINGEVEFAIRVRRDCGDLCLAISADNRDVGLKPKELIFKAEGPNGSDGSEGVQLSMLGFEVQPVQVVEGSIPSLVRLVGDDEFPGYRVNGAERFANAFVAEETFPTFPDREVKVICSCGPVRFCESDKEVIKGAALSLEGCGDDGGHDVRRILCELHIDAFGPVVLALSREFVWLCLGKGSDMLRSHIDLSVRPRQGSFGISEVGFGG